MRNEASLRVFALVILLGVSAERLAFAAPEPRAMQMGQAGQAAPLNDEETQGDLPAGHPSVAAEESDTEADPHAQVDKGALPPGVFKAPPDTAIEDDKLPAGTIAITILDADNKPIADAPVTIGIVHNSVAKGENREHKSQNADASGNVVFDHLETGSVVAYRVTAPRDGATFAATPFRLDEKKGMRVTLHAYEVSRTLPPMIFGQGTLILEMKDDRLQIEESLTVFNLGRIAWLPDDVTIAMPSDFTGFSAGQAMSDTGVDAIGKGLRLRGTFAPGRHDVEFRWQVPYADTDSISFDAGLPPNFVAMRVISAASNQMKLEVAGFEPAVSRSDAEGAHFLVTERQITRGEGPMRSVHVTLRDLPTAGPASKIVTSLAGCVALFGIVLGATTRRAKRTTASRKSERARLLDDLVDLETAHRTGDVGPKTYERARRELVDAIARTFA